MIQTLTKEEESKLLRTIHDELRISEGRKYFKVARDLVLFLLGLQCGFRVGEVLKLRVSDVWTGTLPLAQIHVPANFNKRNVEGWVKIHPSLQEALSLYVPLRLAAARPDETDPILVVPRPGLPRRKDTMDRPGVFLLIQYWSKKAGVRHFKFHTLRHTFATRILQAQPGAIKTVQSLLRHRNISSSAIYLHPSQDELDLAIMKAWPTTLIQPEAKP